MGAMKELLVWLTWSGIMILSIPTVCVYLGPHFKKLSWHVGTLLKRRAINGEKSQMEHCARSAFLGKEVTMK